jgi:hypothetical protein
VFRYTNLSPVLDPGVTRDVRRFRPYDDANDLTLTDDLAGLRPGAAVK